MRDLSILHGCKIYTHVIPLNQTGDAGSEAGMTAKLFFNNDLFS